MEYSIIPIDCFMTAKPKPLDTQMSDTSRIPQEKIVGGSIVAPNSLPFQVSIQRRPSPGVDWMHYCGGSILDSNFVVTAAHCVYG